MRALCLDGLERGGQVRVEVVDIAGARDDEAAAGLFGGVVVGGVFFVPWRSAGGDGEAAHGQNCDELLHGFSPSIC